MAEILLYGIVGDPIDKLDAATVTTAIRAARGPLSIRINSPGGYVMEGLAIVAAIRAYPDKLTIYIDGLAASMASVIAAVGAEIVMAESALVMIHNPWDQVIGDAPQLRSAADQLDRIRDQMVGIYAQRTGLPEPQLVSMLNAETWFDAQQALDAGFVTSIAAPLKLAAMAKATGFGFRHLPDSLQQQDTNMTDTAQALATERTRVATIMALSDKHNVPASISRTLIERGTELSDARASILEYLAGESDRQAIGHAFTEHRTLDNPATYRAAVTDALVAKIGGRAAEGPAAEFRGLSVVDIARDSLVRGGLRDATRMSADRVLTEAMRPGSGRPGFGARGDISGGMHTSSDFPDLIGSASEKYIIERYQLQESPLKQLARSRDLPNFLIHYGVQMSGFAGLDTVNEAGEIKNRTFTTRKEGYGLKSYANIFAISRQMLVNDGLGALSDVLNVMATGATETEALLLAGVINANIALGDGVTWFDARHNNLGVTGGIPNVALLDAGRLAMRTQKDLDGAHLIDANPKFLVVPAALQTSAETLVASTIAPTTVSDVNPFQGKLQVISDPRLAAVPWYLFADPNFSPALQYSYLNGQTTPFLDQEMGWRVDGTEYKVRHDFGAGVMDYRMAFKNPGA